MTRQIAFVVGVFLTVIGTDQAVKWWSWRHLDGTLINAGGYILLGPTIRSWFAAPVSGAIANALGFLLVGVATWWLVRRRHAPAVSLGVAAIVSGALSNLLDRVGLHEWSAPGSERGVVDMIPSGGTSRANVADVWILLGGLVLAYTGWRARRQRGRPTP